MVKHKKMNEENFYTLSDWAHLREKGSNREIIDSLLGENEEKRKIISFLQNIPKKGKSPKCLSDIMASVSTSESDQYMFKTILRFLNLFGVLKYERDSAGKVTVKIRNDEREIPSNFLESLTLYIKHDFNLLGLWEQIHAPTGLWAGNFLEYMERRRIKKSEESGFIPEPLRQKPVILGIIKAKSARRGQVFLLRKEPDWGRYNFIYSRYQPNNESPQERAIRTITDLFKVSPEEDFEVKLLNESEDIVNLAISFKTRAYTEYPIRFFHIIFGKEVELYLNDTYKWCSREEINRGKTREGYEIMINPKNLIELEDKYCWGGLEKLPFSLNYEVEPVAETGEELEGAETQIGSRAVNKEASWLNQRKERIAGFFGYFIGKVLKGLLSKNGD